MARGRREKPKTDGGILPPKVPGLSSAENVAFAALVADLNRTGYAQACDVQAVILAARRMARVQKLCQMVDALPSLLIVGGNGQEVLHPLCTERRNAERDLADSLRVLSLTPMARKSIRVGGNEVDQEVSATNKEQAKLLRFLA
jgi:hypothetical protein